ncbi:imidazole glycerol phosphate synthase subunit HisH [Buchnera aphidicola]|uniref:Imidazole glycerol phosphate synthase subunit HisH n=1 Tax=Buchnera aphidicola (Stegophylla sp.) TaxID=2315800 RepID=A0A4D6YIQ3_9GAMM|nr:imidazole glycerol phosphate synthase subunit HisH [Buchnera aphidicola (Stegophylla sp.)]QCI26261.1 imidazole glycerol phosphate synthase subunit HisH [Buchnera aphidicola (Stegophylla sp.)]
MNIVILDTNCANLLSVKLSIQKLGYNPIVTDDLDKIVNADKLLIPGVGSSKAIMKQLKLKKLVNVIKHLLCPVLGICLGMQLLSTFSEESCGIKMIGIMNTYVSLLNVDTLPLPHTGWNQVIFCKKHYLFTGIQSKSWFYFNHSYSIAINKYTIAETYYGFYFSSIVQKNNFIGVQFHPEKSGVVGSRLLLNFLEN